MRRLLVVIGLTAAVAVGATAAQAESVRVAGTGSYERLVVHNGDRHLVFKIHGPGRMCGKIDVLRVEFTDRDGSRYATSAVCIEGEYWEWTLEHHGQIDGFKLRYNAQTKVWTETIARSSMPRLAGDVKVTESYLDDYTSTMNEVPPTRYVNRG